MESCSLNYHDELELKRYVEENNMIFISTPFSRAAVDRLVKMNVSAFKIGSGECNNYPLIEYICKFQKPIILSTGMNNIGQIKKTVSILNRYKVKFALNHCTNIYPSNYSHARLNFITKLKKIFPKIIIGLSDHSKDEKVAIAAIAAGAEVIEKHIALDNQKKGLDVEFSLKGKKIKHFREVIDKTYRLLGNKEFYRNQSEEKSKLFRRSIFVIKNIKKGEKISQNNISTFRPTVGLSAKFYFKILGKKVKRDIKAYSPIYSSYL